MQARRIYVDQNGGAQFAAGHSGTATETVARCDADKSLRYQELVEKILDQAIKNSELDSAIKGILNALTSSSDSMSGLVRTIGPEDLIKHVFKPALRGGSGRVYLRMILEIIRTHLTSYELRPVQGLNDITNAMDATIRRLPTQ